VTSRADIVGTTTGSLSYSLALSYEGSPLDLSTVDTVNAYIKPSPTSLDSAGHQYTIGSGITVSNSPLGEVTWVIPAADVGSNGWYRVDVVDTLGNPNPAVYGKLIIVPV
jgi:hypothetical protein